MIATPWGYDVESLPSLVSPEEFAQMSGGAFSADDERLPYVLDQVSSTVRAFCGWHVAPSLACSCRTQGPGVVVALPTLAMSAVSSVAVMGVELRAGEYEWRRDGLMRRVPCRPWPFPWGSVEVEFESGFEAAAVSDLAAVVFQVAANAMSAAPGVRREQAGGVSIEYNQTANGVTGGVALLARDMAMLAPYRLPAVPR